MIFLSFFSWCLGCVMSCLCCFFMCVCWFYGFLNVFLVLFILFFMFCLLNFMLFSMSCFCSVWLNVIRSFRRSFFLTVCLSLCVVFNMSLCLDHVIPSVFSYFHLSVLHNLLCFQWLFSSSPFEHSFFPLDFIDSLPLFSRLVFPSFIICSVLFSFCFFIFQFMDVLLSIFLSISRSFFLFLD